jgi:hypothetical protein
MGKTAVADIVVDPVRSIEDTDPAILQADPELAETVGAKNLNRLEVDA